VTVRGLGRRTLKTITHHAQPHTEADNETYMQTYPQKSFPSSCNGPMVSLLSRPR